ncbi:MAG: HAMP domain-containing sensor histidine kinase [Terracidiphilus sp.]|jgi:signal transduction histidine kinase
MPDYYQVPALVLTSLLVPAFGYLYFRFRDTRTLLWFLGFLFAALRMAVLTRLGTWDGQGEPHPWLTAAGQTSIQISSALFLASLSPLRFRMGRFQVLYAIPYTLPLVAYSILFHGVLHGATPSGALFAVFPALGILALTAGLFWAVAKGSLPVRLGVTFCIAGGAAGLWSYYALGPIAPLRLVECCNQLLTALLVVYTFRRWSTGMVLTILGFLLWSAPPLLLVPAVAHSTVLDLEFTRAIILGKVIAAMGMILLSLEDELAINQAAQERERRARRELEAYIKLILSRRRVEDFDRQAAEICQTVTAYSRFAQAALILQSGARYRLAGSAGLDKATAAALDELAVNISVEGFLAPGTAPSAVDQSQTRALDLEPWLRPGDDLKRLHFTSMLAVPMVGRSVTEGALLLAGMRNSPVRTPNGDLPHRYEDPLRADDLLPIEMLTARLQATRSQTMMLEKLIDSEKFAGLGQLAGNVTQQLNNPLTVILGYASLLEETSSLEPQERRGVESILTEARRMRATLESLTRISRPQNGQFTAVSVAEMLTDLEQLHRSEFLQRSIEFRMNIAPSLPRVRCHAQQLRQAVLHCLQFAIEAVESRQIASTSEEVKAVRLEATAEGNMVQITISHTGPSFLHPDRAFDPFVPAQATGETAGLGLSLCATILRDHHGRASAVNLEPRGAAIILELKAA